MKTKLHLSLLAGLATVAACSEPPPPRSAQDFVDNPIMLEAAVVRCSQNRSETRYDAECINAREAVKLIEAKEDAIRKIEFDAMSARKREALRRTQQAAAEARRRATEERRRRSEADYLAQFGEPPPREDGAKGPSGNVPLAVIPNAEDVDVSSNYSETALPATDGGNAPVVESPEPAADLQSIRDELKRRGDNSTD